MECIYEGPKVTRATRTEAWGNTISEADIEMSNKSWRTNITNAWLQNKILHDCKQWVPSESSPVYLFGMMADNQAGAFSVIISHLIFLFLTKLPQKIIFQGFLLVSDPISLITSDIVLVTGDLWMAIIATITVQYTKRSAPLRN